jgi:hypothetical protein
MNTLMPNPFVYGTAALLSDYQTNKKEYPMAKRINHKRFPNPLPPELHGPFFQMGFDDGNLKDDVVGAGPHTWSAKLLKPTQKDVYLGKALGMAIGGVAGGDLKSVVSHDNYILDGHHRWAATLLNKPSATITGIQVALDIKDLVPVLRAAGDAFGNTRRGAPKGDLNIFRSTMQDAMEAILEGKGMDSKFYDKQKAVAWLAGIGGEAVLKKRLGFIKRARTPPRSPRRMNMPVIDDQKNQEAIVARYLREGKIDIYAPYYLKNIK